MNFDIIAYGTQGALIYHSLPPQIKDNFCKAFNRLFSAGVEIPAAWLEGISNAQKTSNDAQIQLIKAVGYKTAQSVTLPDQYVEAVTLKSFKRIFGEQLNLDSVLSNTPAQLKGLLDQTSGSHGSEKKEISDDWLNTFEKAAGEKSSEEMRLLFSKVLAGEIIRPGTYSIRAIQILSSLETEVAKLFQLFCSCSVALKFEGKYFDVRVCGLNGQASQNSLASFGLSFQNLNLLLEYGLIISDFNSQHTYGQNAFVPRFSIFPFYYRNQFSTILEKDTNISPPEFNIRGVSLTKCGRELFPIIDQVDASHYKIAFEAYLSGLNKKLEVIPKMDLYGPLL